MALPRTPVDHHEYEPHIALVRDECLTKPKCRAILIHWDKEAADYLGLLKLACALLWLRHHIRLAATVARP